MFPGAGEDTDSYRKNTKDAKRNRSERDVERGERDHAPRDIDDETTRVRERGR
jgi:hypothetical protein